MAIKNLPEKVYLQVDCDGETPEDFKELTQVCWCAEKVFPNDVEYVLAESTTTVGGSGKERCPYELFVIKYFGLPEDVSFDKVPKVTYADIVSILAMYSEKEYSLPIKEFAEKEANKHFNKEISSYAWEACVSSCLAGHAHRGPAVTVDIVEQLKEIKKAIQWMWDNMSVKDQSLQSDQFNIPANALDQIDWLCELIESKLPAPSVVTLIEGLEDVNFNYTLNSNEKKAIEQAIAYIRNGAGQSEQEDQQQLFIDVIRFVKKMDKEILSIYDMSASLKKQYTITKNK